MSKLQPEKNQTDKHLAGRRLKGMVVSDKMDKTVVVKVVRLESHPRFGKKIRIAKRYKAHDESNQKTVGEEVTIVECRPKSKDKSFIVL